MRPLSFVEVSKNYGALLALRPASLDVIAGEFVTLLGPSGSGKTTLLNIAAGHVAPSGGRVLIGGRDVTALPARRRNIGMVFQSYALFPHLDVFENVAYGLRARGLAGTAGRQRVAAALASVQLAVLVGRAVTGGGAGGMGVGDGAVALVRPESVRLQSTGLAGGVEESVYLGDLLSIRLRLANGQQIWCRRFAREGAAPTETATLGWSTEEVRILPISAMPARAEATDQQGG